MNTRLRRAGDTKFPGDATPVRRGRRNPRVLRPRRSPGGRRRSRLKRTGFHGARTRWDLINAKTPRRKEAGVLGFYLLAPSGRGGGARIDGKVAVGSGLKSWAILAPGAVWPNGCAGMGAEILSATVRRPAATPPQQPRSERQEEPGPSPARGVSFRRTVNPSPAATGPTGRTHPG